MVAEVPRQDRSPNEARAAGSGGAAGGPAGWWGAGDGGAVAEAVPWAAGGSRAEAAAAAAAVREGDGAAGAAGPAAADGAAGRGGGAAAPGGRADRRCRCRGPDRDLALAAGSDPAPPRGRGRLPGGPGRRPGAGAARRARLVDLARSRPGRLVVRIVAGRTEARLLGAKVGGATADGMAIRVDLVPSSPEPFVNDTRYSLPVQSTENEPGAFAPEHFIRTDAGQTQSDAGIGDLDLAR